MSSIFTDLLEEIKKLTGETCRHEEREWRREVLETLREILHTLKQPYHRVLGGAFVQIPIGGIMVPIQPGSKPRFLVTPTFSAAPFALDPTKAAISTDDADATSSIVTDGVNGPADGTVFEIDLADVTIPAGGLSIAVDWSYTNTDGTVAHVTGTLTENGIVDDVTGGTFAQVA